MSCGADSAHCNLNPWQQIGKARIKRCNKPVLSRLAQIIVIQQGKCKSTLRSGRSIIMWNEQTQIVPGIVTLPSIIGRGETESVRSSEQPSMLGSKNTVSF